MTEHLTKRNGHWQFICRLPNAFRHVDKRDVVKLSTKIEVSKDRRHRGAIGQSALAVAGTGSETGRTPLGSASDIDVAAVVNVFRQQRLAIKL
jgi:hypothetical protein